MTPNPNMPKAHQRQHALAVKARTLADRLTVAAIPQEKNKVAHGERAVQVGLR